MAHQRRCRCFHSSGGGAVNLFRSPFKIGNVDHEWTGLPSHIQQPVAFLRVKQNRHDAAGRYGRERTPALSVRWTDGQDISKEAKRLTS